RLRDPAPTSLVTLSLHDALPIFAAVASRLAGRPLAVTDHGLGGGGWCGMLPRLFDRFLVVSRFSARTMGVPPDRTVVVYGEPMVDRKSTRLNSSHRTISYAVFCL